MKRRICRWRPITMGSACGVEAPNCTIVMTAAAAATGTTVCMTMHNWQWSASDWLGCRCVAWATASIASKTRHSTATAGKKPGQTPRLQRRFVLSPANRWNLPVLLYRKLSKVWTLWAWRGCPLVTISGRRAKKRRRGVRTCYSLSRGMALPTKIGPDEAESEGCGGSTVEDDNEVWPDFHRNPKGWGQFPPFHRRSSLEDTPYSSLLAPRTEKNWLPAPPVGK